MASRTIEVRATEFRDINEAMGFAEAEGTEVVSVGGGRCLRTGLRKNLEYLLVSRSFLSVFVSESTMNA
jgi:hypothetical protein